MKRTRHSSTRTHRVARTAAAVALASVVAAPAFAHHGVATSRVTEVPRVTAVAPDFAEKRVGVEVGAEFGAAHHGRTLDRRGDSAYGDLGHITAYTLRLDTAVRFGSGTRLGVTLPVGTLTVAPESGRTQHETGLGDLSLRVGQDVELGPNRRSAVRVSAGIVAPTGPYSPNRQLAMSELVPGAGGALDMQTHITQASLSADVWSVTAAVGADTPIAPRARLQPTVGVIVPVSRTREGIQWGTELTAGVDAAVSGRQERGNFRFGVTGLHRTAESAPLLEREEGDPARERTGGRSQVGLRVGGGWQGASARCEAAVHVPVWQYTRSVQLVETGVATFGCAWRSSGRVGKR